MTLEERFWSKVEKTDSCWIWKAARLKDKKGNLTYGMFKLNGKMVKASRLVYQMTKGPIPFGLNVLHSCDNPPCVNPEHLFLGTIKDNNQDALRKGRKTGKGLTTLNRKYGEEHFNHVLTEKIVLEMRTSNLSSYKLSEIYGIPSQTIRHVLARRTWKHI